MPIKKENTICQLLNISDPWKIDVLSYSKSARYVDICLSMSGSYLDCPVCGKPAMVIGKRPLEWKYLNIFDYETNITAYLPIVDRHNPQCRAEFNQSILRNTLALDLLLMMSGESNSVKPFEMLLNATEWNCALRSISSPASVQL